MMWSLASRASKQRGKRIPKSLFSAQFNSRHSHSPCGATLVLRPSCISWNATVQHLRCRDIPSTTGQDHAAARSFFSNTTLPPPPPSPSTLPPPPPLPEDMDDTSSLLDEQRAVDSLRQHNISNKEPAMGDIVHAIERSTNDKSSVAVDFAFDLLNRLMHTTKPGTEEESKIPPDMLNRVINTWKASWKEGSTSTTPKFVFNKLRSHDLVQRQLVPALQPDLVTYQMIIDATKWNTKQPDIAEEILDYCIEASSSSSDRNNKNITYNPKLRPDSTTFHSVMDAWAQSHRLHAPLAAENVLKKMIKYSSTPPDVVSYNCVISAWAAAAGASPDEAPHRVRKLLEDMKQQGLTPDRYTYLGALATLIKSNDTADIKYAVRLLKRMNRLYEQGDVNMKPDASCCSAIISVCASRGYIALAEKVLQEQMKLYESTKDRDFLPNPDCFKKLLRAWSMANTKESAQKAETVIHRMRDLAVSLNDETYIPDVGCFNRVLRAWVRSPHPHGPQRSEDVLQMMQELYQAGYTECRPNLCSYYSVILCWGKSTETKALERAETIFRSVVSQYENGDERCKPNADLYLAMLNAVSNSGIPDAAQRGQVLFDDLKHKHATGDQRVGPYPRMAGVLIRLWSRSEQKDAALNAQTIFDGMLTMFRLTGNKSMKPKATHYDDLLYAWAQLGDGEKAEELFRKLQRSNADGVHPPKGSYNNVLNAWARSSHSEAPERARAIFDEMMEISNAGFKEVKPNNMTFGILMTLWSRSRRKDSTAQAKSLFDMMEAEYVAGDEDCKPEITQVFALINALALAGEAENAEAILRQLEAGRFEGLKPHVRCYSAVINAWARSQSPAAPMRAQAVYDSLKQQYEAGDVDLKPESSTLTTLITAWGRSKSERGAYVAQSLLNEMQVNASRVSGEEEMKSYNAAIDAWAKIGNADRAEEILRQVEANCAAGVKPDIVIYNTVLSAWSRSDRPDATTHGLALFDEMKKKYENGDVEVKPDRTTYVILITLLSRSNLSDAADKAQALFEEAVAKYKNGDANFKPDLYLCNSLIGAWAKSRFMENADDMLQEMTEKFEVKPDFLTYAKVLNAWAGSRRPNAAERAHIAFNRMLQQYDAGDQDSKPNSQIFGLMMKIWCQTATYKGASCVQAIFDNLCARYKAGDTDMEPNLIQYNILMDAWGRAGEPQRAEAILLNMWTRSKQGECPAPDVQSFSVVAAGWARVRHVDAALKAENLLRVSQKLSQDGLNCPPNKFLYTNVMKAWIGSGHIDWMSRVESLISEMASEASAGNHAAAPDIVPCTIYLTALAKSPLLDKDNRAFGLMAFMKKHGIEADQHFRQLAALFHRNR